MANKKGTGLFMVWVDVPADNLAEFNGYYNEEHLAELLAVPGVLNAARYEAVSSGPKHLAEQFSRPLEPQTLEARQKVRQLLPYVEQFYQSWRPNTTP